MNLLLNIVVVRGYLTRLVSGGSFWTRNFNTICLISVQDGCMRLASYPGSGGLDGCGSEKTC